MQTPGIDRHWKKVTIWGAAKFGEQCHELLSRNSIEVTRFVDRTPPECGVLNGVPVIESKHFLADPAHIADQDAVIFAMLSDHRPMRDELRRLGFAGDLVTYHTWMKESDLLKQRRRLLGARILHHDGGEQDCKLIDALVTVLDRQFPEAATLGLYGASPTTRYLLETSPALRARATCVIDARAQPDWTECKGIPVIRPSSDNCPNAVWLCATAYLENLDARETLCALKTPPRLFDWETLASALPEAMQPHHAYQDTEYHIYPLPIPPITFEPDLDFLLLDLPARFLGLLPNGLGYVNNILKATGCRFQTADLDMIFYHRYHSRRLLDGEERLYTPSGRETPMDPWGVTTVEDFWYDQDYVDFFRKEIDRTVERLIAANPKILGLSLHGTNRLVSNEIIARLRKARPEMIIVVGGYDCNNARTSPRVIEDYDYMVIFEAENSLPTLIEALLAGRRHFHIPGVIAKKQVGSPLGTPFAPAELPEDIDTLGFPTYEWADVDLYRNYNAYQLIPIILSRGCRWSRCTFCGERFHWRRRDPVKVADEIEWFVERGGRLFHFNDSDLSGDPNAVRGVCEDILRRGIRDITMVGQLRVQKGYTPDYFKVLREAGFGNLRYDIDGWSKNTLKLHKKGYTLDMIEEVLTYTKSAGIGVGINLVIGIPGETEADIDETIANIIRNRDKFDLIENLNTLILTTASVYWTDPAKYGIVLQGDKDELELKYPIVIPTSLWHSEGPFIDQEVRRLRLERILDTTAAYNIKIGGYADRQAKRLTADPAAS